MPTRQRKPQGPTIRRISLTSDAPRVLLLDIETFPILASVWDIWDQNVGLDMIEHDWHLASYAAKWLGGKHCEYEDQSHRRDMEDDRPLLKRLHKLLDHADIVVAQNGRRFDIPKINARLITQGFLPPSPYKIVDTLDIAKRQFKFTSNKLAFLSEALGLKQKKLAHKKFPGYLLWKECKRKNLEAWQEMRAYNIADVESLEELYLKLRPWDTSHPNLSTYVDDEESACPKCLSKALRCNGYKVTVVGKYRRFQCGDCGAYARGSRLVNTTEKRRALVRVA